MPAWTVVRDADTSTYGLAQIESDAIISRHKHDDGTLWGTADLAEARLLASRLNGRAAKRPVSAEEFEQLTAHVPMRPDTAAAVRAVVVTGYTWRLASQRYKVTESGILRAMRRIARLNPQCERWFTT